MHKAHDGLGVSFDLPDSLTVRQLDAYQIALQSAVAKLNGNLSDARYYAILYGVAVESGLVTNWKSTTMPDATPATVDDADARIIYWTGRTIREFIRAITEIPPN